MALENLTGAQSWNPGREEVHGRVAVRECVCVHGKERGGCLQELRGWGGAGVGWGGSNPKGLHH